MSKIRLKKQLTDRQREIFDFIASFISEIGYPPTLREIGERFRISEKASYDHVNRLVRKGYIEYEYYKPRTLRLTPLSRMFSFAAPSGLKHLGIQAGDVLTVSPADVLPVAGDLVLTSQGRIAAFQNGQQILGKVIGLSRPL